MRHLVIYFIAAMLVASCESKQNLSQKALLPISENTVMPSQIASDGIWLEIIRCSKELVVPDNIQISKAHQVHYDIYQNWYQTIHVNPFNPDAISPDFSFLLSVTNNLPSQIVFRSIRINTKFKSDIPETINIMAKWLRCGFDPLSIHKPTSQTQPSLSTQNNNYNLQYGDYAEGKIILKPKESQSFAINLACESPGIYDVSLTIDYESKRKYPNYNNCTTYSLNMPSKFFILV